MNLVDKILVSSIQESIIILEGFKALIDIIINQVNLFYRFKYSSYFPLTQAWLAQSVEHETLNLRVVGSSPTLGGNIFLRTSCILIQSAWINSFFWGLSLQDKFFFWFPSNLSAMKIDYHRHRIQPAATLSIQLNSWFRKEQVKPLGWFSCQTTEFSGNWQVYAHKH